MNFKKTCRRETFASISKRLLLVGPPIIAWSWGKEKSKTDRSWFDQTSKVQKNISTITPDKRTCLITLEALVKCLSPDLKNYFQDICTAELPSVGVVQPCGATVHCGAHHTNPLLCPSAMAMPSSNCAIASSPLPVSLKLPQPQYSSSPHSLLLVIGWKQSVGKKN